MAKIKVRVKQGDKGKPLGERIAQFKAQEGEKGKPLYRSKARLTTHIKYGE